MQHRLGITTVYVTHDQVEAMTLADRVAIFVTIKAAKDFEAELDTAVGVCFEPAGLYLFDERGARLRRGPTCRRVRATRRAGVGWTSIGAARWLKGRLGKTLPGSLMKAGGFPRAS